MRASALALVAAACGACGSPARSPADAARACLPAARVEAAFMAELVTVCGEHEDVVDVETDCPEFAAIDAKYKTLREAAMRQCQ